MVSPTQATDQAAPPEAPAPVRTFSRAERIGLLAEWILAGLRTSQIAREWARAGWGELTTAEVIKAAREAHEIIKTDAEVDPGLERAKAVGRYSDMLARALEIQDYRTALKAQAELTRLTDRAAAEASLTGGD